MNFDPIKIKHALDTAQNMRAIYFAYFHKDKPCVSVNSLLEIVQKNLEKNVVLSFHEDNYKDHTMHSFIEMQQDGSFEICLLSGMTNCWNRFALCKELFHVILDAEENRYKSIKDHLHDFRSSISDVTVEGREASKNEILTEFAAMQFLFPYQRRVECFAKLENPEIDKVAYYKELAQQFRVPRLLIEDYLTDDMVEFFDAISWNEKSDKR